MLASDAMLKPSAASAYVAIDLGWHQRSRGLRINNDGQVVGTYNWTTPPFPRGFSWDRWVLGELDTLGGYKTIHQTVQMRSSITD